MKKKEMKGGVFNECLPMNIFLTGCLHGQGGEGSAKCRQLQKGGGGGFKITENMQISFMNGPSEVFLIDLVLLSLQYL